MTILLGNEEYAVLAYIHTHPKTDHWNILGKGEKEEVLMPRKAGNFSGISSGEKPSIGSKV